MRTDAVHLGGLAAVAALVAGGAALAFERASSDVLTAAPEELADWAARYETELLTQSLFFVLSTGFVVLAWSGLRARVRGPAATLMFGAALVYAGMSLSAQAVQVAMARSAADGISADVVAALAELMTVLLLVANLPLLIAVGAVAVAGGVPGDVAGHRGSAVPVWFARLSAAVALVHVLPLLGIVATQGVMSTEGVVGYLAYPALVGWLVGLAVVLLRAPEPAPRTQEPLVRTP